MRHENEAPAASETLELLRSPEPIQSQTTLQLTRQSARRMAMQIAWRRISAQLGHLNRAERRQVWKQTNFSDLARALVAAEVMPSAPQQPASAGTPAPR